MEALSRLIPPPRVHRHRYHGVLAPNARLRARVIALERDDIETADLEEGPPDAPGEETAVHAIEGSAATLTGAAGAFRTEVLARGHSLIADEPKSVGGEGLGPTPYDLLAAALGACTTMTLQMYADRKDWPLEEAVVRLKHSKIHSEDEERAEEGKARMDRLDRTVQLIGPLDEAQRARLLEIADRCPVHQTLSAGVRIETEPG